MSAAVAKATKFDAITTAVIANRLDGIVREMNNVLLRTARSAVIANAKDFSCAIATADHQLLACTEGNPALIFGVHNQARAVADTHPDLAEGDAYIDNDPYVGNSHAADHSIIVPVFIDGEHMFTAIAKAHQADCGNSRPTTYFSSARDVYEEGAIIFPAVRLQRDSQMIEDIVRMGMRRIRVPEQWYGDTLAALGAARTAERRLKELCAKYGRETIRTFVVDWLDYTEKRMAAAIETLPRVQLHNETRHDPYEPHLPDGAPIRLTLDVDPQAGRIVVDLRDNIDNLPCGLNLTEATTKAAVFSSIFRSLDQGIPKNSGAFRRVDILIREGCAIGKPRHPYSASVATTGLAERLSNCVSSAFAKLDDAHGLGEGPLVIGPGHAVVSGSDARYGDAPFVNQLISAVNGGPASPTADGWLTYGLSAASGLMYRDSIEINELKMPIRYDHLRLIAGSAGAGRTRGAPGCQLAYGAINRPVTVIYDCDGQITPPRGVRGGLDGMLADGWLQKSDGERVDLSNTVFLDIVPGELLFGIDSSGGGFGNPHEREPERVRRDVLERWETIERARDVYGVALTLTENGENVEIDAEATKMLRGRERI